MSASNTFYCDPAWTDKLSTCPTGIRGNLDQLQHQYHFFAGGLSDLTVNFGTDGDKITRFEISAADWSNRPRVRFRNDSYQVILTSKPLNETMTDPAGSSILLRRIDGQEAVAPVGPWVTVSFYGQNQLCMKYSASDAKFWYGSDWWTESGELIPRPQGFTGNLADRR